ncbi:prolyl oligopeptidase family serine peptidase [uncultured Winogradskyella sp.]|uniref:carboxylesterase family protein n=1 Tax=uncultured Winogradskyella sp. TaxID=395353 RepID=UPI00261621C8|nr:prolyl oligopeptidase family serine peptidase [uncultured Winogradskyella sp.]
MKHFISFFSLVLFTSFCSLNAQEGKSSKDLFSYEAHVVDSDTLNYRMLLPENFDESKTYPLVLFLHGAGERGDNNKNQLVHGSSLFLNETTRDSLPAIIIFPQCAKGDYWSKFEADRTTKPITFKYKYNDNPTTAMALVMDLMDNMVSQPFVKTDQVYVMGLSMGGMGTFEILYRKPKMFAAAIPICGGGDPESAVSYATDVPLWIIHGAKDDVVDPKLSLSMASAILSAGGFPKLTIYDFANHNSWDPAFAEPELLTWLFSNSK